jgi:hypothetical protein
MDVVFVGAIALMLVAMLGIVLGCDKLGVRR